MPDPRDLLAGVAMLLAEDGLYVNESPSLRELVAHNEFDTIYHEHVVYLSLRALVGLFDRSGLRLVDAVPQAVHGGHAACQRRAARKRASRKRTGRDLARARRTPLASPTCERCDSLPIGRRRFGTICDS